jgi:two-component system, sensor histidine kinase and response regulator
MSTVAPLAKETVAALRHQLRTPLNHIIGYTEMLLEEDLPADPSVRKELEGIRQNARQILESLNLILPPNGAVRDTSIEPLRAALAEPITAIVRSIGNVAQAVPSSQLMDLLRINVAAGELLSFTEGTARIELQPQPQRRTTRRQAAATGYLLVVDDNEANRDMLRRQLERQGHRVDTAEDGVDALRQSAEKPFDLVLLDVLMPGMDGLAVLEAIKADPARAGVAVVMISALDELNQVVECLQAGAEDYLMKPFEPILLQARIGASLERKRLRDREQERSRELERANEELQQFAYIASHDLQEPLRTMSVYAQLLHRRWRDRMDSDSEQFLNFIVDAARRMQTLVGDVLALSRVSRTAAPPPAKPVDLEEIIRQVQANLEASIAESGAVVTHDRLPVVMSDFAEMTQLLQNLVGNGIKYRRPGVQPRVHIAAVRQDDEWKISVEDNGVGIRPEYAEHVFLPFKRLHGRDVPGTGIGLALCRRIVERHGGRIWVEPAPNGGSSFRFTIPIEPRNAAREPVAEHEPVVSSP